jgi:hypothetical protein
MYGDRNRQDGSDDDLDQEGVKDEDEDSDGVLASNSISTSENLVSLPMIQNQQMQSQEDFRMRLPVRYHTQPQMEEHPTYADSSSFPRSVGIGFRPQSPSVNDPIRRSFASPSYQSPQQNMFRWPNNLVSNGPVSSYYVTNSPQPTLAAPTAPYQLPPPNTHMLPPPLGQHHFDGLPRQYDSVSPLSNQLRTGSLGHLYHMHHDFQEYLYDNGGYGQSESELKDAQHINPNQ